MRRLQVDAGVAVGLALLGVLVAETAEALRVYVKCGNRWPESIPPGRYLVASAIRLVLAALVAAALFALGLLCDENLAFLAGLSTLKVADIMFGYSPAA